MVWGKVDEVIHDGDEEGMVNRFKLQSGCDWLGLNPLIQVTLLIDHIINSSGKQTIKNRGLPPSSSAFLPDQLTFDLYFKLFLLPFTVTRCSWLESITQTKTESNKIYIKNPCVLSSHFSWLTTVSAGSQATMFEDNTWNSYVKCLTLRWWSRSIDAGRRWLSMVMDLLRHGEPLNSVGTVIDVQSSTVSNFNRRFRSLGVSLLSLNPVLMCQCRTSSGYQTETVSSLLQPGIVIT